ncbi:MAG: hypothetical protein BV457_05790 [Thermoplasmata archaeon M9B1D]|nr:MAG: hypothetical protein BV457_05790 [Thermoplasmata archaeon M9B1D]
MKIKRFYQITFYMIICVIFTPVVNSDTNSDDYLDQEQIYCSNSYLAVETPCILAQSFKPTLNVLTRVSLYGWRNEMPPNNLIVSIRNIYNGKDLTSVIIDNSDIPEHNSDWFYADFPDVSVVPNSTYYIVLTTTSGVIGGSFFWWSYAEGNPTDDPYSKGDMWLRCSCPGWLKQEFSDFCFKTYGYNDEGLNLPPGNPLIYGRINGKLGNEYEYSFVSIDPDEDNVTYSINWGDGTNEVMIGPCESGSKVSVDHIWLKQGKYTIHSKARDVYGGESEWSSFEVSIMKSKSITLKNIFERLIQGFPFMVKILNQIV